MIKRLVRLPVVVFVFAAMAVLVVPLSAIYLLNRMLVELWELTSEEIR